MGGVYTSPNTQKTLNLGVSMPLLDWGRNSNNISLATSNLKTLAFSVQQEQANLVQEITILVENIKLIANTIEMSKKADQIAQERYQLSNELYRFGKISVTDLNISLEEKDNAKRAFVGMLRNFWIAFYQLKMATASD
ncbi:TolC family protein [Pedobacter sp. N36a]|uniref:TolC family protein n=1 Tax=Pedobacter sp. N36a TaxID=2767996 RepID=UPI001656A3AF|nr:TolC family protein [Pedobacter sp. N36a]